MSTEAMRSVVYLFERSSEESRRECLDILNQRFGQGRFDPNQTSAAVVEDTAQLKKDSELLRYLKVAGVEEWPGYTYAKSLCSG